MAVHWLLCMLAYYVRWHMDKALGPIQQQPGYGSFHAVLERWGRSRATRSRSPNSGSTGSPSRIPTSSAASIPWACPSRSQNANVAFSDAALGAQYVRSP